MNSTFEPLFTVRLVPDELELTELKIDRYIDWLTQDNPNCFLSNKEMIELDLEISFFQKRQQDLAGECDQLLAQRLFQFKQETIALRNTNPPTSRIGAPHQVEARQRDWFGRAMNRLEADRDHELNLIRGRYTSLIQECKQQIDRARACLKDAKQRQLKPEDPLN